RRQPCRIKKNKNHSKYHPFEFRRSFAGADLRLREAKRRASYMDGRVFQRSAGGKLPVKTGPV
ncbi:MAG: hypothetical protein ILP09_00675, partial [Oscillospiraceae bacterium]|nr:hypothetical protein [Oscillospiraceae bacterium]